MCCGEGNWQIANGNWPKSQKRSRGRLRSKDLLDAGSQARVPVPQVLKGSLDLRFESKADMEE